MSNKVTEYTAKVTEYTTTIFKLTQQLADEHGVCITNMSMDWEEGHCFGVEIMSSLLVILDGQTINIKETDSDNQPAP